MGDDNEKEINITFETLYELLRREKDRSDLQKLDTNFYNDLVNYLKEKKAIIDRPSVQTDLLSMGEKQKTQKQFENIIRVVKELYERREKKIINMALTMSRTKSQLMDKSALVGEELKLFNRTVDLLNCFRTGILESVIRTELPKECKVIFGEDKEEDNRKEEQTEPEKTDVKFIKFLMDVPKFVGKELEVYGPYSNGETADLPSYLADILINKGKAEEA